MALERYLFGCRITSALLGFDAAEDLFPMHGNILGCVDTDSHLIALHPQDGERNVVPDLD
jgi:hypothetical protein